MYLLILQSKDFKLVYKIIIEIPPLLYYNTVKYYSMCLQEIILMAMFYRY